jgi:hypothetical protein
MRPITVPAVATDLARGSNQNGIASWWRSTFGFGGEQPELLSLVGLHGELPGAPRSKGSARNANKSGQRALRSCGA